MLKIIIAGSRTCTDYNILLKAIEQAKPTITEIVSGCARGADELGELYAHVNKIPVKKFAAEWRTYGKSAGAIRNQKMANYADGLIALWDGKSTGTDNMIQIALRRLLPVFVYRYDIGDMVKI